MEKGCLAVLVFGVPTPLIMIMITKRTKIEHLITMVITKVLHRCFSCSCSRCSDPTELGAHSSTLNCRQCKVATLTMVINDYVDDDVGDVGDVGDGDNGGNDGSA